jgi:hypothetical protein
MPSSDSWLPKNPLAAYATSFQKIAGMLNFLESSSLSCTEVLIFCPGRKLFTWMSRILGNLDLLCSYHTSILGISCFCPKFRKSLLSHMIRTPTNLKELLQRDVFSLPFFAVTFLRSADLFSSGHALNTTSQSSYGR